METPTIEERLELIERQASEGSKLYWLAVDAVHALREKDARIKELEAMLLKEGK